MGPSRREWTNQGLCPRKTESKLRRRGEERDRKNQKEKERKNEASEDFFFVLMMMLYLSAGLSHWWNHMVPALTRDGFPQCARLGLWTSFGDVDGYMLTYMLTHIIHTHTCTRHTHAHTYIHTYIHAHMACTTGWSCVPLKQTRELSVHETGDGIP